MDSTERTGKTAPRPPHEASSSGLRDGRLRRRIVFGFGLVVAGAAAVLIVRPRTDPDELWRRAQEDLRADRLAEAERAADRIARLREPTAADLMLRAQLATARGRDDEALAQLEPIFEDSAFAPQALLLAGQIELRRDRLRRAERFFRRALEHDRPPVQASRELIYLHGYRSQSEEIEEQFGRLAAAGPLAPEEVFLWSLIRGVQWTPEEIVEQLTRAVAQDPEDRQSRIALSDALLDLNRFDEAEAVLGPLDPSDPASRAALGRMALERGDVELLRALLDDAPEDHVGLALLRGTLALQLRDPEAAIAAYRAALRSRPNDRDALSGLAQALNQAGRSEEAAGVVRGLNRVNALNTLLNEVSKVGARRDPGMYVELGSACEAVGFHPQARAWYQLALADDPFHREAQEALARLGGREAERADGT